jgi:MFS family permease
MNSTRYLKGLLILLVLLLIFLKSTLIYVIITSYLPIQAEYTLDNTQLGLIATIYYITTLFGTLTWTYFFQQWSKLKILSLGGMFWVLGMIIIALSSSYSLLLFGAAISGFGTEAILIVTINYFINIIPEKKRGQAVSVFFIFQGAGGLVGNIIAGITEGVYSYSWRYMIGGIALVSGVILISTIFVLQRTDKIFFTETNSLVEISPDVENIFQPMKEKLTFKRLKEVLSNKVNLFIFLFLIFYGPAQHFNNVWLQKYWVDTHSLTQISASISFTFTSGAEFLGFALSGFLVDKIGVKQKYNISKLGVLACFLSSPFLFIGYLIPWNNSMIINNESNYFLICWNMFQIAVQNPSIFGSYVMLFLGFFIIQLMGAQFFNLIITYNVPRDRPLAINLGIILIDIALLNGPIIGGLIADAFSFETLLLSVPIIYASCGFIYILIYKTCKKMIPVKKIPIDLSRRKES